jgi:NTP pyrophosphatase (non-canonical NTP hydrolase)
MSKQVRIGDLNLGTEVRFGGMIWIIKRKEEESGSVTLALKDSIKNMEFDAAEPGNRDEWVADYGNNIYELSNIRQWLNSKGKNWYQDQHEYDAAPSYADKKGFVSKFSKKELKRIISKNTVDGHFKDNFYLPSDEEKDLVTGDEFDRNWVWTRTPYSGISCYARIVHSSGSLGNSVAYGGTFGVRPLCDLISGAKIGKINGAWKIAKKKKKSEKRKKVKAKDILNSAIAKWGVESQTMMAIEEMSELQKEICKMKRGQFDKEHILEELADVQIMIWQLEIIFGEPKDQISKKLARLEELVK